MCTRKGLFAEVTAGLQRAISDNMVSSVKDTWAVGYIIRALLASKKVDEAMRMKAEVIESGGTLDVYAYSALISAVDSQGPQPKQEALGYWAEMKTLGVIPNPIVYNTLISLLMKLGEIGLAEHYFKEMLQLPVDKNTPFVYGNLIDGWLQHDRPDKVMEWFEHARKHGVELPMITRSAVMNLYKRQGNLEKAEEIFNEKTSNLPPNEIAYSALITGFVEDGNIEKAKEYLTKMQSLKMELNPVGRRNIIMAAARQGKSCVGLADALGTSLTLDPENYSFTLKTMVKAHVPAAAVEGLCKEMENHGMPLGTDQYNRLIDYYTHDPCIDLPKAEKTMEEMVKAGIPPTEFNFVDLVQGYKRVGDMESMVKTVIRMNQLGMTPPLKIFNAMLNWFRENGQFDLCLSLFKEMKSRGIQPDSATMLGLIR